MDAWHGPLIGAQGGLGEAVTHHPAEKVGGLRYANPPYDLRLRRYPVHRADLVAVWITQIRQIELSRGTFTNAGRLLAGRRAIGDAGRMPGVGLLRRIGDKADGAAIGRRRR